jgi:Na+-driven multidrug efflux pump
VAGLTFLFAEPLIGVYSLAQESADMARQLLLYHCVFAMVMWPIAFTTPYSFRAAGDVKFPMVISMTCMWVFRVVLAYPLALPEVHVLGLTIPGMNLGIMGVWIAMTIDWIFRTSIYAVHYLNGKWLNKKSVA